MKSIKPIKLDEKSLQNLIKNSRIILDDRNGPRVLQLANGNYLKFFRTKRYLSSALFYHYADRYIDNTKKLIMLNIATTPIINSYKIPKNFIKNSKSTRAIEYQYLYGTTIRDLVSANKIEKNLVVKFGEFIAKLHHLGIYFRAAHLANIIYNPNLDDCFGLIDVENLKLYGQPLSPAKRKRNFKHIMKYECDKNWLLRNISEFNAGYNKVAGQSII